MREIKPRRIFRVSKGRPDYFAGVRAVCSALEEGKVVSGMILRKIVTTRVISVIATELGEGNFSLFKSFVSLCFVFLQCDCYCYKDDFTVT